MALLTAIDLAERIPNFEYDPERGSFKAWLLNLTRWRILDHLRKRARAAKAAAPPASTQTGTRAIERIADPAALDLDVLWENEWKANVTRAALEAVRQKADPEKFQMFDLYVNQEWPPEKVATAFGVKVGRVYLAKHRITKLLQAEYRQLEAKLT